MPDGSGSPGHQQCGVPDIAGGVDQVKVQVIARHLGVSRSSFYWFFKDRQDLLDQLLAHWRATNTAAIVERAGRPAATPCRAVLHVFECWVREEYFKPRLERAREKWVESVENSDRYYLMWQKEFIEDKQSWRKLGGEFRSIQKELRQLGAEGYPTDPMYHWDEEALAAVAQTMIEYFNERRGQIPEAGEKSERLQRLAEAANDESAESGYALHEFNRHVLFRAEAMGTLSSVLSDFRQSLRRDLGKHNELYRSIRWPISLSPDERVL